MRTTFMLISLVLILGVYSCSSNIEDPAPSPPVATPEPNNPPPPDTPHPSTGGYKMDSSLKYKGELVTLLAIQPDGRMIIADPNTISRINKDGSLDPSFSIGTAGDGEFHSLTLMEDGRILLGGTFKSFSGLNKSHILRLNNDGTLDENFHFPINKKQEGNIDIEIICILKNGKILLGGKFEYLPVSIGEDDESIFVYSLLRIEQDGSYDPTFMKLSSGQPASNVGVKDIHEMSDGKLLITGSMLTYYYYHNEVSPTPYRVIFKLNPDGSLDTSFKFDGAIELTGRYSHLSPFIKKIHVENDGKIVLLGAFHGRRNTPAENYHGMIRLTPNGEVDQSFPNNGSILNTSTALIGENRFIGAMQNPEHRLGQAVTAFFVTDLNWNINEEISNGISGLKNGDTYAMEIDEDGKLVMAGVFNIMHDEGLYKSLIRIIPE